MMKDWLMGGDTDFFGLGVIGFGWLDFCCWLVVKCFFIVGEWFVVGCIFLGSIYSII